MYRNFDTGTWHGVVNVENGVIIATEKSHCVLPRNKELNINYDVNQFPHTDEDFIILAARKALED